MVLPKLALPLTDRYIQAQSGNDVKPEKTILFDAVSVWPDNLDKSANGDIVRSDESKQLWNNQVPRGTKATLVQSGDRRGHVNVRGNVRPETGETVRSGTDLVGTGDFREQNEWEKKAAAVLAPLKTAQEQDAALAKIYQEFDAAP